MFFYRTKKLGDLGELDLKSMTFIIFYIKTRCFLQFKFAKHVGELEREWIY